MTRKQKQQHKHRVKPRRIPAAHEMPAGVVGPRIEIKDFSNAPAALESALKAGRLRGIMTIYRLTGATENQWQLGMMNADLTIEQVFDLVCQVRRTMQQSYGFVDLADDRLMADVTDKTIEALHARIGDGLLLPRLLKELREAIEWGGPIDKTGLPELTDRLAAAIEVPEGQRPPEAFPLGDGDAPAQGPQQLDYAGERMPVGETRDPPTSCTYPNCDCAITVLGQTGPLPRTMCPRFGDADAE